MNFSPTPLKSKLRGNPNENTKKDIKIDKKDKIVKNILPEGITLSQLSLKWILMHDAVSIVIPGAKNKDHVGLNTSASELNEISSLMNEINSVYTKYFFDDVHHRW